LEVSALSTNLDISVILTAHREGVIAGVSARSAQAALLQSTAEGLSHEIIVVLDRADSVTASTLRSALGGFARFLETDEGDPGLARNRGIEIARGLCAAFLDCDDLWTENWLVEAWRLVEKRPEIVAHSACNLIFGDRRLFWWHVDSESALCDPGYLSWMNYWDAMSFARTSLFRKFPFRRNDLELGFGHEDWHWNALTLAAGVPHKPVAKTMHFKRSRAGSQTEKVERAGGIRWPLESER
jgi:glycosyltransferase involved in cell wall biosynthesis